LQERGLRAGLDVFANEPGSGVAEWAMPLAHEPNLYGTHHIGASTEQAQEAIAAETVRIVQNFKDTGRVPNVVNLARRTPATHTLVVRHLDRPGVLANVLDAISAPQINVQEMENIIFEGSQAAVARINLDTAPTTSLLQAIAAGNDNILELSLLEI
jgi:D-3-phosphoglycerate dehydrogenase